MRIYYTRSTNDIFPVRFIHERSTRTWSKMFYFFLSTKFRLNLYDV